MLMVSLFTFLIVFGHWPFLLDANVSERVQRDPNFGQTFLPKIRILLEIIISFSV